MVEVVTVGRDGMLGMSAVLNGDPSPVTTMVQAETDICYGMSAKAFRQEMDRRGAFYELLTRYRQPLVGFIMQSTACTLSTQSSNGCRAGSDSVTDGRMTGRHRLTAQADVLPQAPGDARLRVGELDALGPNATMPTDDSSLRIHQRDATRGPRQVVPDAIALRPDPAGAAAASTAGIPNARPVAQFESSAAMLHRPKQSPATIEGTEHLGAYGGFGPKSVGAVCVPSDFTVVFEVPPGILGPRNGQVVVDLIEPGSDAEPLAHPAEEVARRLCRRGPTCDGQNLPDISQK
jgi:hypothetical protein